MVTVAADGVEASIRRPDLVGALLGKAAAVAKISSQSTASRAKHLRDLDSLARPLGVPDREAADLTNNERRMLAGLIDSSGLSHIATVSMRLLIGDY